MRSIKSKTTVEVDKLSDTAIDGKVLKSMVGTWTWKVGLRPAALSSPAVYFFKTSDKNNN